VQLSAPARLHGRRKNRLLLLPEQKDRGYDAAAPLSAGIDGQSGEVPAAPFRTRAAESWRRDGEIFDGWSGRGSPHLGRVGTWLGRLCTGSGTGVYPGGARCALDGARRYRLGAARARSGGDPVPLPGGSRPEWGDPVPLPGGPRPGWGWPVPGSSGPKCVEWQRLTPVGDGVRIARLTGSRGPLRRTAAGSIPAPWGSRPRLGRAARLRRA
jgi:hypothetical protein